MKLQRRPHSKDLFSHRTGMKRFFLKLPKQSTEIWIGKGAFEKFVKTTKVNPETPQQAFLICDSKLKTQLRKWVSELRHAGWDVKYKRVSVSEKLKDFKNVYPLYGWLLEEQADRSSVLFAIGGGVIGDVVGFIAGTYLRGVSWIGVPSTLLAQVDSSIGGKTGINHSCGKNLVGVVHQPSAVLCDPDLIISLPRREVLSGLAEMIKYGLVFDPPFFTDLEKNWKHFLSEGSPTLTDAIHRSLLWKAKMVRLDEHDKLGRRAILNFGHTFAHALEAESGYGTFKHGGAVIHGMRVAVILSFQLGYLEESVTKRIETFLSSLPVPPIPPELSTVRLISRMKWDKKNQKGRLNFILLKRLGQAALVQGIEKRTIAQAIKKVRMMYEEKNSDPPWA